MCLPEVFEHNGWTQVEYVSSSPKVKWHKFVNNLHKTQHGYFMRMEVINE